MLHYYKSITERQVAVFYHPARGLIEPHQEVINYFVTLKCAGSQIGP